MPVKIRLAQRGKKKIEHTELLLLTHVHQEMVSLLKI